MGRVLLDSTAIYDPATNRWKHAAPIPTPRDHLTAAAAGGLVYAIGGRPLDPRRHAAAAAAYHPPPPPRARGAPPPPPRGGAAPPLLPRPPPPPPRPAPHSPRLWGVTYPSPLPTPFVS